MTASERASDEIRNALHRIVTGEGGRMVKRQMYPARPDLDWEQDEPEPLAAIRAALALRDAATIAVARSARHAREDGRTWEEVGEAVGCVRNPVNGDTPGTTAFYLLATAFPPRGRPTFTWTCLACLKTIMDHGPDAGHPADAEEGHADGCTRLAETIREWDERTS